MVPRRVCFSRPICKILNSHELLAESPGSRLQNIDSAGLASKILQTMDLDPLKCKLDLGSYRGVPRFCVFRTATLKILISKNLDGTDLYGLWQNLEPLRLTRKILRNTYLAQRCEIGATPFG